MVGGLTNVAKYSYDAVVQCVNYKTSVSNCDLNTFRVQVIALAVKIKTTLNNEPIVNESVQ